MSKILMTATDVKRAFPVSGGDFWALKGLSLVIPQGGLTILKGRSGSGKTTMMNMLGALDYPTSGGVLFENTDIIKLSDKKRDQLRAKEMGFVFQSVALTGMMTAYENVEFILRLSNYPIKERPERVKACLEKVGLGARMFHMPAELSGGEQQRVAIARAIAHRPKIIFADEPTSQLDSSMGLQVLKVFKNLIEDEGATIVMATHDPGLMELADQVYELQDGAIIV